MISLLSHNKLDESKNSLNITYPRSVNIIFGNYAYPDIVHNFILQIKNNLDSKMENFTNVKGGMTNWKYFIDKIDFINFVAHIINKHQTTHPNLFQFFLEKYEILTAWGNEIKPNDKLTYHTHPCYHGILYLTKGCDLILPELNIKITPKPGDYYIFPPQIEHGFDEYNGENNRYSVVFNIEEKDSKWNFNKKLKEKNERENS
jgi:hypothetical protein